MNNLSKVVRQCANILNHDTWADGNRNVKIVIERLKSAGAIAKIHEGKPETFLESSPNHQVEQYAGQLLSILETQSFFAVNGTLNNVDRFCPEEEQQQYKEPRQKLYIVQVINIDHIDAAIFNETTSYLELFTNKQSACQQAAAHLERVFASLQNQQGLSLYEMEDHKALEKKIEDYKDFVFSDNWEYDQAIEMIKDFNQYPYICYSIFINIVEKETQ